MHYSDIQFTLKGNIFHSNLEGDFACFALWQDARPFLEEIRKVLKNRFEILLETEMVWSKEYFHSNAQRLYEAPIYLNENQEFLQSIHGNKIGGNSFILFIIKDENPLYTYAQSVSGKIEITNLNFVDAKYTFRDWIFEKTNKKYGVHSTNNIYEFFFQVPLLLGVDRFKKLLNSEIIEEVRIEKDLEGAKGWESYKDLFEILNLTCNYLVQRGFETLPESNPEKDIDFLTDNHQRLASALGAIQNRNQSYKGKIKVAEEWISLDMRYVGDKYYDVVWEKNMLDNKIMHNNIYIPREDDYFFSLLYHAKAQKSSVKDKYIPILEQLAKQLKFNWYNSNKLNDNKFIAKALKGFYEANGYFYEDAIDKGVYKNQEIIETLPSFKVIKPKKLLKIKTRLYPYIPKSLIKIKKKILG